MYLKKKSKGFVVLTTLVIISAIGFFYWTTVKFFPISSNPREEYVRSDYRIVFLDSCNPFED